MRTVNKKNSTQQPPTIEEHRNIPPNPYRTGGGLRPQGKSSKTSKPDRPFVSIITIVFNNAKTIEETILSILNQTYEHIEYIIIDGGSTDGTLEMIRKYSDRIAYWLSEPDKGIYDAMNKGAMLARGEWINFMNAGDTFYRADTIEKVFSENRENTDLIYGNNEILYNDDLKVIRRALDIKHIWKGIIANHQSLFVKAALMREHPFDITYKIGSDFEFIYSAYMNDRTFQRVDDVISSTAHGGFSDLNVIANIKEQWTIAKKFDSSFAVDLYYIWSIVYAHIKNAIKAILPEKAKTLVIKKKYK
jgi:glycosyltransferase involved in cell wall biosynthesis